MPLVSTTPNGPLVLANTTSAALNADSDNLSLQPSGPPVAANTPINLVSAFTGHYVRADNVTTFAYSANGTGSTAPEQFLVVDPANPDSLTPVQAGQTAILRSVATGAYCRLAPTPMPTSRTVGVVCDQPTVATAARLTYTGSGFSFKGVPLVAATPGGPLLLASTALKLPPVASAQMSTPQIMPGARSAPQAPASGAVRRALSAAHRAPPQGRSPPTCPTTSWPWAAASLPVPPPQ